MLMACESARPAAFLVTQEPGAAARDELLGYLTIRRTAQVSGYGGSHGKPVVHIGEIAA